MDTSTNSSNALRSPDQLLDDAAETFRRRNSTYGDNYRLFPSVMVGLFPNGLSVKSYEDWMRLQFLVLDVVKTTRYAQNFHSGGHQDSIHDKIVYAAMLESTDAEEAYYNSQPDSHTNGK